MPSTKSLDPQPIFKRIYVKIFPRYLDVTDGVGVIPTMVLQAVPELKVDISSMESIYHE